LHLVGDLFEVEVLLFLQTQSILRVKR